MRRTCVLDASLVLTLSATVQLDVFLSQSRYDWVITPLVRGELIRRESREAGREEHQGARLLGEEG